MDISLQYWFYSFVDPFGEFDNGVLILVDCPDTLSAMASIRKHVNERRPVVGNHHSALISFQMVDEKFISEDDQRNPRYTRVVPLIYTAGDTSFTEWEHAL